MKDLLLLSADGLISHTFRTDLLANDGSNFSILAIDPPAGTNNGPALDSLLLFNTIFQRLPFSLAAFKAFCVTNSLRVTAQDANGNNPSVIVPWSSPAGTHVALASATGSTKTILVASDVHTTFLSGNHIVIYNADFSIFGKFTLSANSTFGSPNTSIVVVETLVDIPTLSGKFIVNLG